MPQLSALGLLDDQMKRSRGLDGLSPGASAALQLSDVMDRDTALQEKERIASQIAEQFKIGTPEAVQQGVALLARINPEKAVEIAKLTTGINPQLQNDLARSKSGGSRRGTLEVEKEFGQLSSELAKIKAENNPAADREGRLKSQFNQQMGFKYQEAAEKSALYKAGIESLNEIPTLRVLLDDAFRNGGQSLSMLGPKIAKGLAGERGVLTESDVTRYVKNPALVQWLVGGAEKKFEGKLTQSDYQNLTRLVGLMERQAKDKVDKAYSNAATKMSRNLKVPLEDTQVLVNPTMELPQALPESGGLSPEKQQRLEQLRRKKAEGTLK